MKNKVSALMLFGIVLIAGMTITACNFGNAPTTSESKSLMDSATSASTTVRYAIKDSQGKEVIASVITYSTVTTTDSNGKQVTALEANYICPCGKTGTVMPPYTVDIIHK